MTKKIFLAIFLSFCGILLKNCAAENWEAIFKTNGSPVLFANYFLDSMPVNREIRANDANQSQIVDRKLTLLKTASNNYPLSRGQIARRISHYEMNLRMDCANGVRRPTDEERRQHGNELIKEFGFCAQWRNKDRIRAKIHDNQNYQRNFKNSKNCLKTGLISLCQTFMHEQKDYLDTFAARLDLPRLEILAHALKNAGNSDMFKSYDRRKNNSDNNADKGAMAWASGNVDSTDLIEILLTLTKQERKEMASKYLLREFCEQMHKNDELEKDFAFGHFMKRLCYNVDYSRPNTGNTGNVPEAYREDTFDEEEQPIDPFELRKWLDFKSNPYKMNYFRQVQDELLKKDYTYLRRLALMLKDMETEKMIGYKGKSFFDIAAENLREAMSIGQKLNIFDWNTSKKIHFWKMIKGVFGEIEKGRPFFFAEVLREKMERIHSGWGVRDAFNDITRILLVRGPIDLAEINEEYAQTVDYKKFSKRKIGCTFMDHLRWLSNKIDGETSPKYDMLQVYIDFVHWVVNEENAELNAKGIEDVPKYMEANFDGHGLPNCYSGLEEAAMEKPRRPTV